MVENKKVPNPHGKLGGLKHRTKVEDVSKEVEKRGLPVKRERVVIKEIYKSKGIKAEFHPYNEEDNEK